MTELSMAIASEPTGPLGKTTDFPSTYTPSLLHAITRETARGAANLPALDHVRGEDLWTAYEFSWLDTSGKPQVAGLRFSVSCQSTAIVESKSLKLYLGSYAQTKFENQPEVLRTLDQDLTLAFRSPLMLELIDLAALDAPVQQLHGTCLDQLDVLVTAYERAPELLQVEDRDRHVHESVFTHLFRSLCPVTGQPDIASVGIEYAGGAISHQSLLKYLISYRNHQAFHETTIEQIYVDIMTCCQPQELSVYGRFQRRGGIDINPFRGTHADQAPVCRLPRQ